MLPSVFPTRRASYLVISASVLTLSWEQRKANEIFYPIDERNHPELPVLSATQDEGMVLRDKSNRFVAHDKSNETGYKRVRPGQFVVHLRSFQGGFAHSEFEGITSPAYTVFALQSAETDDDRYWKHVFMSKSFIRSLTTVTYGIRDGRSISFDEFMDMELTAPSRAEQHSIATAIDRIDNLITLHLREPPY